MANYFPSLYQVNIRVWLTDISRQLGKKATLDDIPDAELDKIADAGFDWVWFLSVWQTGRAGQIISRGNPGWRKEFEETLPDLKEDDIAGSGFAITRYEVADNLGGEAALARLRNRLRQRNLKLMLDFVPNHTGLDHWWITEHPEFYILAGEADMLREPANYTRIGGESVGQVVAHGRDPYFPGWPDTAQLNYGNRDLQDAMIGELVKIANQCDGVRCDMAMLVLPEVFEKTWGINCDPFWPEATRRVREENRDFCFLAEVYWDMEWTMISQGFDYTYDKRLYDRLKEEHARPVRAHLSAPVGYQKSMARFLENHDEPRVAAAFSHGVHEASAIVTYFSPGLRFFHQGQSDGRLKRISPHLVRAPEETVNKQINGFYSKLLEVLRKPVFRNGEWQMLNCREAWDGNRSNENYIAFLWKGSSDEKMLVVVNYASYRSQCYINLPFNDIAGKSCLFSDLMSDIKLERDGGDIQAKGLYVDEPQWKYYIFSVTMH